MSLWGCPEHGYVGPGPCCGRASLVHAVAGPPQQHVSSVIADGDLIAKLQAENAKLREVLREYVEAYPTNFAFPDYSAIGRMAQRRSIERQDRARALLEPSQGGVRCEQCGFVRTVWKVCPSGCDTRVTT
jgi:hypothetical protein